MYKTIEELVTKVDERNSDGTISELIGVSIDKCFIKSVANTNGTDLSKYKIIRRNDFAVSLMQVSRDGKIPIARLEEYEEAIMSPAYPIFRVKDKNIILPEYLEMWFKRPEFDREAAFIAVGGVRGSMPWEEFAKMKLPVPPIEKQQKIVNAYKIVTDRIALKQRINDNLINTTDTIFFKVFLENKPTATISFTDIVQLMGGGTPKTDEDSFWNGNILFFTPKDISRSPLLEKRINIRASDYRFTDKKKYYEGFTNSKGQVKEGTGVVELLDLTATSADFTEKDIIDRYKKMIDCFINYLQKNSLIK